MQCVVCQYLFLNTVCGVINKSIYVAGQLQFLHIKGGHPVYQFEGSLCYWQDKTPKSLRSTSIITSYLIRAFIDISSLRRHMLKGSYHIRVSLIVIAINQIYKMACSEMFMIICECSFTYGRPRLHIYTPVQPIMYCRRLKGMAAKPGFDSEHHKNIRKKLKIIILCSKPVCK